jgi:hypothetical protein
VELAVTTGSSDASCSRRSACSRPRRARGPFLAVFAAIALSWLFEPMSMITGAFALIALGTAGASDRAESHSDTKGTCERHGESRSV